MRLLIDLNVVLDVLLDREPHAGPSAAVWAALEAGAGAGCLSAHGITTLHYIAARGRGPAFAERCVRDVLSVFDVCPVDGSVIARALALGMADFEDAVTVAAAEANGCVAVVTRDLAGFRSGPLPVFDPASALAALRAKRS